MSKERGRISGGTKWENNRSAPSFPPRPPSISASSHGRTELARQCRRSPRCGRGSALGRAGLSHGHALRRSAAASGRRVSGVGCGAIHHLRRAAFRELTISNLIALEYTMQPGLPADSEITKNGLLGDICYRSFQEEIKEDGAALGSFPELNNCFSLLFSGPVRTPASGGRSLICGAWTDRSSGEHYPGGRLVELPMKKDL